PAYSPELNLIEILWRQMKYAWLPLSARLILNKHLALYIRESFFSGDTSIFLTW
ncbi:transposase, partial [Halomonas sp. 18H]